MLFLTEKYILSTKSSAVSQISHKFRKIWKDEKKSQTSEKSRDFSTEFQEQSEYLIKTCY